MIISLVYIVLFIYLVKNFSTVLRALFALVGLYILKETYDFMCLFLASELLSTLFICVLAILIPALDSLFWQDPPDIETNPNGFLRSDKEENRFI